METSAEFDKIVDAIHKVQQDVQIIERSDKADIGSYKYSYAGMPTIWKELKPLLETYKLTIMQPVVHDMIDKLETWIFHESGQWVKAKSRLVIGRDDPQGFGSAVTYAKRYQVLSMLEIVTDEDTDASEHRLATAQQKLKIVGAVKLVFPDLNKPEDINKTLENILGKHPSRIREDEAENAISLIQAFTSKQIKE